MAAYSQRQPPYRGHLNGNVAEKLFQYSGLAPEFPDADHKYQLPLGRYMAMGDNTLNSSDSRFWGDFPQENIIGKCWFVYWPFTERFGWGYR